MKIQISVRATGLTNVAGAFKGTSDPFAVVTMLGRKTGEKPQILGKTEVIKNTLDPEWSKSFKVDYTLGEPVNLLVKIYDRVSGGDNIPMGSRIFDLGSILGAKGNTKAKKVRDDNGTIYVKAQQAEESGTLRLKMSGTGLTNLDGFFNKSDPFFVFRKNGFVVHKSDYIKNDLNPDWDEVKLDLGLLCGDDLDEKLSLRIFDNESSGEHELMGQVILSVNDLISAAGESSEIDLIKDGEKTGGLLIQVAEVSGIPGSVEDEPEEEPPAEEDVVVEPDKKGPSFADYLAGGCEINLTVGIDFTGSNGNPIEPGTLHYMHDDGQKNDYEKAISSIGRILDKFDTDKQYPVLGFGAKYGGEVRHLFQCGSTEVVDGIDGVLHAYRETFESGLIMSSPTDITHVVRKAASRAMDNQTRAFEEGKQSYGVLLIVTDGAVSDVEATARCLDAITHVPLSIVIVGVGEADFSDMEFLDERRGSGTDNVSFVKFNEYAEDPTGLTMATLAEIPAQLERFFLSHGIMPMPPVDIGEDEIVVEPFAEEEEIDLSIDFGADGNTMKVGSE